MPYPVQVDHDFSKHWYKRNAWNFVLASAGFSAIFIDGYFFQSFGVSGIVGVAAFIISIFRWAWQDKRILDNYHCPTCAKHLHGPLIRDLGPEVKEAFTYDCKDCQTTWDTTLRVPRD
ncbi:MAG: hypothetical protein AAF085_07870 [Planctomycetota bacterium]